VGLGQPTTIGAEQVSIPACPAKRATGMAPAGAPPTVFVIGDDDDNDDDKLASALAKLAER
jgi:hypothetical protein